MAPKYPGSGGASSNACIRSQFEYDVKTGKILDLSLRPFTRQDHTNAVETLDNIAPNVLVIRDLGYTCVKAVRGIKKNCAFFISRLINGADVYKLKGDNHVKANFNALNRYLKRHSLNSLEMDVYVTEQKEPVSMIEQRLPEDVIRQS